MELEDIEKNIGQIASKLRSSERSSKSTKSEFRAGDILYGKLHPYLNKLTVADGPGYSTTEIVALRPYVPLCSAYCAMALRLSDFLEYMTIAGQGTEMSGLRTKDAIAAAFPLPPAAEKFRIFAKVDELMAFFDKVEKNITSFDSVSIHLSKAVITRISRSEVPEEITS